MLADQSLLITTAAFVAFVHTIIGPDHYLVFVALGKARKWSTLKTLKYTTLCGIGHVMSSILIGFIGIYLGLELIKLVNIENSRGIFSGWALLFFGLMYFVWGLRKVKIHNNQKNLLESDNQSIVNSTSKESSISITPWALFMIFILGPCEALIPLFMYPAIEANIELVIAVAFVFGVVTLMTMLVAVFLIMKGLNFINFYSFEKYSHVIAGASIMICAIAINFIGL
tara:strand:- start:282 stop:962 length:681 start_codon:yes stop_codon:yes gene_type:complete